MNNSKKRTNRACENQREEGNKKKSERFILREKRIRGGSKVMKLRFQHRKIHCAKKARRKKKMKR